MKVYSAPGVCCCGTGARWRCSTIRCPGFEVFVGAALIFPIYAALLLLGIAEFESSRSLFAVILLHIEFFIIRAVIWPLAMHYIVQALDRDEKYRSTSWRIIGRTS